MRVASLRLSWCLPTKEDAFGKTAESRAMDLWGYVQEDSVADAFLLAVADSDKWSGHERFFIVAPEISSAQMDTMPLVSKCFPEVPLKDGKSFAGKQGLFDCSKAAELLGWYHRDEVFD
jgi:nucleoside-diphosphate-sugar epimerase